MHLAPPPPIQPGFELSPGKIGRGVEGSPQRRLQGVERRQKGASAAVLEQTKQGFPPGSSHTTSLGSTPPAPDPAARGPKSNEPAEEESREGEPDLQIWSRGRITSPPHGRNLPAPRRPSSRGSRPAPPAHAASRRRRRLAAKAAALYPESFSREKRRRPRRHLHRPPHRRCPAAASGDGKGGREDGEGRHRGNPRRPRAALGRAARGRGGEELFFG